MFHSGSYAVTSLASGCYDAATRYRPGGGPVRVAVTDGLAHRPFLLLPALAHQVGHVRLLCEQRIAPDQHDNELLADLLPVFFGLRIFAANAAVEIFKSIRQLRPSSDISQLAVMVRPSSLNVPANRWRNPGASRHNRQTPPSRLIR